MSKKPYAVRAMQSTYEDIKDKINTVPLFLLRWGLSSAEIASEAFLAFIHAYQRYDPERGKAFEDYVSETVHFLAKSNVRDRLRKERRQNRNRVSGETAMGVSSREGDSEPWEYVIPSPVIDFDFLDRLEWLSQDGKRIINLLLTKKYLIQTLREKSKYGQISPQKTKMYLTQYLAKRGWDLFRIRQAFRDVSDLFSGRT